MSKTFRVGIIGCGNIFPMHAVSLASMENIELVAVCDVKEDRAKKHAADFDCKYYLDYKEMIDNENLDVVHLCTPHHLHAEMTIYAARKKVHVFTEKPMATTVEDALAMVEACKENGVTLGVIL